MLSKDKESESNIMLKELKKAESKVEEINISIKSLYKDKVTGKIPEKIFYNLLEDFENELKNCENTASVLREKLDIKAATESEISLFADRISKCLDLTSMNKFLARELIESITVSAYYKVDGETTQDVDINYKFFEAGYVIAVILRQRNNHFIMAVLGQKKLWSLSKMTIKLWRRRFVYR